MRPQEWVRERSRPTRVGALLLLTSLAASDAVLAQQNIREALSAGPFVRMVRHSDGSRSVTARDENTKEMAITTYDVEGNLKLKRVYQLDRYGKPTTFLIYNGAGRPLMRGEYEYDARERIVAERLFELPSQQPIRTLAQNYDSRGKRLSPQYMHQGSLPPEVMRWLDPDAAAADDQGTKKPEEFRLGLFGKKKGEGTGQGGLLSRPGNGGTGTNSEPKKKGLRGLFNRTKR